MNARCSGSRMALSPSLLAAFLACLWPSGPAAAAPFTPLEWQGTRQREGGGQVTGKLLSWDRDRDQNFIDDLLDGRPPAEKVDVIVDFNRCVTCCDEGEEEVLTFLGRLGKVDHVSQVVSFAVVVGVPVSELAAIAARPEVAMVEYLAPSFGMLDTSVRVVRARAGTAFSPDTAEDAFPAVDGAGITVAMLDSGVDNAGGPGTTHAMFPAGSVIGGANCLSDPCAPGDPDDDHGHGTLIAGVALGRPVACGGDTCRGVAPAASLVDIKALDSTGACVGASCIRGVELAIANRELWSIDVLNISIGDCVASNGRNATAVLLNTAVSLGLVVVAPVGNATQCGVPDGTALIGSWASASLAFTVGAIDDHGTVPLDDDSAAPFALRGPRLSDGDPDPRDEMKPELTAPGVIIQSAEHDSASGLVNASGTSLAAAHVAGAVALLLQRFPGMDPMSLKALLFEHTAPGTNAPPATFDPGWGHGFLDLFEAIRQEAVADPGRPSEPPYAPCGAGWCSPHISTDTPPMLGVANLITAQVTNFTASFANDVGVCFGAYVFSNNFNRFFELGCGKLDMPAGATMPISWPWTPGPELIPPGFSATDPIHVSLKVRLAYFPDLNFSNNEMQRNISVAQASIARVPFRLENNLGHKVRLELETATDSRWRAQVTQNGKPVDPVWTLEPGDCPQDVVVELTPPAEARKGDRATFVLKVVADGKLDFGGAVVEAVVEHEGEAEPDDRGSRWPPGCWWALIAFVLLLLWLLLRGRRAAP